jgi:hypothetical protein
VNPTVVTEVVGSGVQIMPSDQEHTDKVTQGGRNLLTLIRAYGTEGIDTKGLTDALRAQLSDVDYEQLHLLEAEGSITIEQVNIHDHTDEYRVYRAVEDLP